MAKPQQTAELQVFPQSYNYDDDFQASNEIEA